MSVPSCRFTSPWIFTIFHLKHLLHIPSPSLTPHPTYDPPDGTADYAFYLPIVAYIWQQVVGYKPLVLLVGDVWLRPPVSFPPTHPHSDHTYWHL